MTAYVIECYDNFNTKVCPGELFFGNFNDQPIPPHLYDFLNDDGENGNNIPGTPIDNVLLDNKVVEDAVMQNDEDIENEIIMVDDDRLISYIEPLQN